MQRRTPGFNLKLALLPSVGRVPAGPDPLFPATGPPDPRIRAWARPDVQDEKTGGDTCTASPPDQGRISGPRAQHQRLRAAASEKTVAAHQAAPQQEHRPPTGRTCHAQPETKKAAHAPVTQEVAPQACLKPGGILQPSFRLQMPQNLDH